MPGRQWDAASKAKVVLEGLKGRSESAICKHHRIKPAEYRRWRKQFLANIARPLEPRRSLSAERDRLLSGMSHHVWEESTKALRVAQELIEALPIPVFFKARDGKHLGANRAWEAYFGVNREAFIGKTVRELFADQPEVAARHQAADEDLWKNPGTRSYELEVPVHGGAQRHTLNYKATFTGADGEIAGLIGVIIDITERKRAEQRQAIEHRVTRILSESESAAEAMPGVLAAFCETLGWACGARWSRDARMGGFRCEETWSHDDPAVGEFLAASGRTIYQPGQAGLIRRVLGRGEPVWIVDVAVEPDFLRGKEAAKAGLRSAFALPIRLGDQVLGALEFFHRETQQPDEWLLKTGVAIGQQIGHSWRAPRPSTSCARASRASATSPACPRTGTGSRTRNCDSRSCRAASSSAPASTRRRTSAASAGTSPRRTSAIPTGRATGRSSSGASPSSTSRSSA